MADKDLFAAIKDYLDRTSPPWIAIGRVESVTGSTVRAFVSNNASSQQVLVGRNITVNPGDQCLLIRPDRNARWVLTATFGTPVIGATASTQVKEIAPPSGLVAQSVGSNLAFSWNAPAQKAVVFEVSKSVTGTEGDATSALVTRGSYYITDESDIFVRVRAIDVDWRKSGWTDWVEGVNTGAAGVGFTLTHITVPMTIPAEHQYILWEHITNDTIVTIDGELVIL